jgi:crossover junction endodeoxyribonuclease RuvC
MRVIGIDPGLRRTGWGVIQVDGNRLRHVGNGVCKSTVSKDLSFRLLEIYLQLREVITLYKPTCAAVENTFVSKDAAGTLKLGQARGIALLVPAEAGLQVYEYAPNKVKKTVVGVGHAVLMLRTLLGSLYAMHFKENMMRGSMRHFQKVGWDNDW